MVAAARKDSEAADRRNEQLRAQLNDTELLLASHQEQLADLKAVMHQMSMDQEDAELAAAASVSTAPSTPGLRTQEPMAKNLDAWHLSLTSTTGEGLVPAAPTSFTHLLHPVLRTDLQANEDFNTLLQMSRKSQPASRVTSGSYGALNVASLGHLNSRDQPQQVIHSPSNASTSSRSAANTCQSSPVTPSSTNSSLSSRDLNVHSVSLKETRFYKRVLTEDIEPTLRLDMAPGLSWLARRTVISSMSEGSLVVEPMPLAARCNIFACSLCGENRQGEEHARSYRFRTSETENAQRYPLCAFCLNRVRLSCDFLGFLRMLKDGHWKAAAGDEEIDAAAWEECVRLRERMFWARIGGGVVPALVRLRESPRTSIEPGGREIITETRPKSNEKDSTRSNDASSHPSSLTLSNPVDQAAAAATTSQDPQSRLVERSDSEPLHVLDQSDDTLAVVADDDDDDDDVVHRSSEYISSSAAAEGLGIDNVVQRQASADSDSHESITIPGAFK